MQSANILLALGGDSGNQVPKFNVTPAEIAVLRAIHGDDAVSEITPVEGALVDADIEKRSNRGELARLKAIYGNARDLEGNLVVDQLFPGVAARVFENLDELELDKSLFAAKERVSSGDFKDNGNGALDSMKVGDLKKLANEHQIDLDGATKKDDIINKLAAAGVTGEVSKQDAGAGDIDEDGVADLDGGVLG